MRVVVLSPNYGERTRTSLLSLSPFKPSKHPRWELVRYVVFSSLLSETLRSRLGFVWWFLDPVLYMAVFYFVFAVIFERGGPDFVVKLLIALVFWRWFDNTVKACAGSLVNGRGLMRQVYVSKFLFPLAAILSQGIKSSVVFVVLILFLLVYGIEVDPAWLGLLPILLVEFLFISGVGVLLAAIIPFFPDLKTLIDYGIQMAFFLSGIFFEISQLSPDVQAYFVLNPMAMLIDQGRGVLLYQATPDWLLLGAIAFVSVLIGCLGTWLLSRYDRDYPALLLV